MITVNKYCLGFEKRFKKRTERTSRGHRVGHDDAASGPVRQGIARRHFRHWHERGCSYRDTVHLE